MMTAIQYICILTLAGFSDPYIVVKYGSETVFKSSVVKKSLNPEWEESATLSAPSADEIIKVVSETCTELLSDV